MIKWFFFSLIGLIFADRTNKMFLQTRVFHPMLLKRLSGGVFLIIIIGIIALRNFADGLLVLVIGLLFFPYLAFYFIQIYHQKQFEDQVVLILDQMILSMMSGKSFRDALLSLSFPKSGQIEFIMEEIAYAVINNDFSISEDKTGGLNSVIQSPSQNFLSAVPRELFFEFKKMNDSKHKVLDKLKSLRWKMKLKKDFKTKVDRSLKQIKAQVLLVSIFYLLLLFYTLVQYSLQVIYPYIWMSFLSFSIGQGLIYYLSKRFKWNI